MLAEANLGHVTEGLLRLIRQPLEIATVEDSSKGYGWYNSEHEQG
jgi:hypothetical protein